MTYFRGVWKSGSIGGRSEQKAWTNVSISSKQWFLPSEHQEVPVTACHILDSLFSFFSSSSLLPTFAFHSIKHTFVCNTPLLCCFTACYSTISEKLLQPVLSSLLDHRRPPPSAVHRPTSSLFPWAAMKAQCWNSQQYILLGCSKILIN